MRRTVRAPGDREEGAVLIIVAIALVVLVGITALAIDGSYGFVQNRRAQNGTDFAAFAASQQLATSEFCDGTTQPSTAQIASIIDQLIQQNEGSGVKWTAEFLSNNHNPVLQANGKPYTFTDLDDSGSPPPGACGVTVSANPVWDPFFAGILGIHKLAGLASGSVAQSSHGNPFGILALNKVGPHEILGGGTGQFVVSGDIVVNSDVTQQPWTGPADGYEWDDAIDAKSNSNLYVYGTIHSVTGSFQGEPLWPLDTCFQTDGLQPSGKDNTYPVGGPAAGLPGVTLGCAEYGGFVTIDYNAIDTSSPQIDDPLQGTGAPSNPVALADNASTINQIACPRMSTQIYSTAPTSGVLQPGVYTNPVELTTAATFEDCSGYAGEGAYPGVYVFQKGLWINPQGGATVTGQNVVIATGQPYPLAGNVPGTTSGATFTAAMTGGNETGGNGAPCLPAGTKSSGPSGHGTPQAEDSSTACSGTGNSLFGVIAYTDKPIAQDNSLTGTGDNFSLLIGGNGNVTLNGPTSGPYAGTDGSPGIALYQDSGTQANFGFDAQTGDSSSINITGVVYNVSLTNYGENAPKDYWDGIGGGIPFYSGGTLQTGFGAGWTGSASDPGPAQSTGSLQITGTAIVDDFNTDGATTITILGQPYSLPGGGGLSLIG